MRYVMQNDEVISDMIALLHLPGTMFDYVIDRDARTITSDLNGVSWPIPERFNLR